MSTISLDRDALLAVHINDITPVDTPVGRVWVRVMDGREREHWERWCVDYRDSDGYCVRALLVIACCCNEMGMLLLGIGDYEAVCAMPASVLIPIADAASKINGLGVDADVEGN